MTTSEECFECGTSEARTFSQQEAMWAVDEDPFAWQRCLQCDQPLCDQCVEDDEHTCLRESR